MGTRTVDRQDDSGAREQPAADGLLLEQFVQGGDQDAFAALMRRHGPYLLAVCRRVTFHEQDAEDVFQACFLELVRRAGAIQRGDSVAGWLQTVAVRLARRARARRARRRQVEATAPMKDATVSPDDITWREVRRILEEEVARLPDELRVPIILCLFQGLSQEEAAGQLQMNRRTLKGRLRRGRERLRGRLTRRGVSLAVLGALLSAGTTQAAVPAALAQVTVQGATAVATKASLAGVVAPGVLALTGSSFVAGWWAALLLLGLLLGGGAFIAWDRRTPVPPTVQRSFRGKQFDGTFFQWYGPMPDKLLRQEDEGLRITLPPKDGPGDARPLAGWPNDASGIMLRHWVRGNFEVEATLEILHLEPPARGGCAGVDLYFWLDSPQRDGLWVGKQKLPDQSLVFTVGQRLTVGDKRGTQNVLTVPAAETTGIARLRVRREGATFSFFAADGEAGAYKLLDTRQIDTADVRLLRFAADSGWQSDVVIDVRLIDFRITADELVGYKP